MYNIYKLDNGLRIVTEYIEHVNSISIGVMVKNGSRNENKDENGISHFIEHLFFKGTSKRSAKDIFEEIENVGGQINAYTSKEATCYYIKALNTHMDLALDVLSDMMLNSKFDEEEIEKEKGVVIEEINMSEDTPEDVLESIFSKKIFKGDSLGRSILGTSDNIRGFTKEKIKQYVDEKYTPENSVISICGKFNEKELIKLINEYFGQWKGKGYSPIYTEPSLNSGITFKNKEIEQVHVNLGLNGLKIGDDRGYSLILLNNVLGGGASSILFQKVREELGICYTIYSYSQPYINKGVFNVYTGVSKQYLDKAITVISEELEKFSKKGINEEQLRINKEKIKASYILGLESTSSRMFSNGKSLLFKDGIKTQEEVIEKIDKINMSDTREVLDMVFKPGILCYSFVGNGLNEEELQNICKNDKFAYNNSCLNSKIKL